MAGSLPGLPMKKLLRARVLAALLPALFAGMAAAQTQPANPGSLPTLYIVGDSTAHVAPDPAQGDKMRVGWGQVIAPFFDPDKIHVVNDAIAGRSSRTFMNEGHWEPIVAELHPGDFVLINFGHNDPGEIGTGKDRGSLPGIGDDTRTITHPDGKTEVVHSFGWYLRKYVGDTRSKGATPILISVTPRNVWTNGKIEMGLGHFREWTAQVAREEHCDYVDLTQITGRQYQKLGPEKVASFFPLDHTHTDREGAELNARSVIAGLKDLPGRPLNPYLSTEGRAVTQASEMSMKLPANPALPTLWIIGDSTVRNGQGVGDLGQWGWGDEIAPYFDTAKINVVNRALGGTSSRTYYDAHWPNVLAMLHKGDVVLMQFGHNDNGGLEGPLRFRSTLPGDGNETRAVDNPLTGQKDTVHSYGWYLRQMIEQAREHGATPIVLSLIPRKIWDGNRIHREDYVQWARQAAADDHAMFVNLNEIIAEQYERMGQAAVEPMFADPHTHTSLAGAQLNAKCVIEGLKGLKHDPLKKDLSAESKPLKAFRKKTAA
jgi:lysophospholipase L1-like esterase